MDDKTRKSLARFLVQNSQVIENVLELPELDQGPGNHAIDISIEDAAEDDRRQFDQFAIDLLETVTSIPSLQDKPAVVGHFRGVSFEKDPDRVLITEAMVPDGFYHATWDGHHLEIRFERMKFELTTHRKSPGPAGSELPVMLRIEGNQVVESSIVDAENWKDPGNNGNEINEQQ